ncbi:hypothetical protein BDP27DRAFT_1315996 [Rhodocollybia butyracea]|uniref:WHIM1 domain-containing protein n=1 Tax=Rhodocollybia butyracea TaxID=206335 RepID=A0A9P5Q534_9AGAR|nr:hypothetical protein BDP27DRAFT_1315996 [Rhodocollybia butyracea]
MAAAPKSHVCPPSNAKHPSDRWESLFVYSFLCRFTNLRGKVEGLETPMDLENALLLREPNAIVTGILSRFILNLRPHTRNLSEDQISSTVASVLGDYFKTSERTIFWDDELHKNVDPFQSLEGGFFATNWNFKLKIMRQLIELQLSHSSEIKDKIDLAWGVTAHRSKKKDPATAPPEPSDPNSRENLQMMPLGQDCSRNRYWIVDKSPRIYISTNPWKTTATFQTISSTREEYISTIEKLKQTAPEVPKGPRGKAKKLSHKENAHRALIQELEERLEIIDAEITRVAKVRRKIEQHKLLMAQAELRQTRTRRQAQRPNYVDQVAADSEDDGDEYNNQEDEGYEEDYTDFVEDYGLRRSSRRKPAEVIGQRRSTRTGVVNANGKREAEAKWETWRGERRSTRLGAPVETQLDFPPPPKRARTDDSALSTTSSEAGPSNTSNDHPLKLKKTSAAALKPNEFPLEQVAGRKKSKYWIYAVEPIAGAAPPANSTPINKDTDSAFDAMQVDIPGNDSVSPSASGSNTNVDSGVDIPASPSPRVQPSEFDRSMAGSLSPISP